MTTKQVVLVGASGFWQWKAFLTEKCLPLRLRFEEKLIAPPKLNPFVWGLVAADQPIDGEFMDQYPNLKTIARTGTGYDAIDIAAARERGVTVTRVAKLNAEAVSEFALAHILAHAKNLVAHHERMVRGEWNRVSSLRIADLVVGIVGLGTIGHALASTLHILGVRHLRGWNRTLRPDVRALAESTGLELATLDEVFTKSDVVVVAVALTPDTIGLVSRQLLMRMKPGALLVNICRGAVVDEQALADIVYLGGVSAALDVFSVEPPSGDVFRVPFMQKLRATERSRSRVLLSPHLAGKTTRSDELIAEQVARNLAGVWTGDLTDVEVV